MGKRYRKSGRQNPEPHVIFLAGEHTLPVVMSVEKVLDKEKPTALVAELIQRQDDWQKILVELRTRHAELATSRELGISFPAAMYGLAQRKQIGFDITEKLPRKTVDELQRKFNLFSRLFLQAGEKASNGEVEEALKLHEQAIAVLRSHSDVRERFLERHLANCARRATGAVAVFLGAGHVGVAKALAKQGVKVTLYYGGNFSPVMLSHPGIHPTGKGTQSERIKHLFQEHVGLYLRDRYELMQGQETLVQQVVPSLEKLRKVGVQELRGFFERSRELGQVGFRRHLVDFLESKGVNLPGNEQMQELLRSTSYPEFRKIKVFEPRR